MHLHEIGQAVSCRRASLQLTQGQLAKLAGLSRLTINQLEAGKLKDLGVMKLFTLLQVLGLDVSLQEKQNQRGVFHRITSYSPAKARPGSRTCTSAG